MTIKITCGYPLPCQNAGLTSVLPSMIWLNGLHFDKLRPEALNIRGWALIIVEKVTEKKIWFIRNNLEYFKNE